MEELYVEGLATHDGPESCTGVREDAGEALAGVRAGRGIEPRNPRSGVPTPSTRWKATSPAALYASHWGTPRGLRAMACTEPPCARTGRAQGLLVWLITGRAVWGTRKW